MKRRALLLIVAGVIVVLSTAVTGAVARTPEPTREPVREVPRLPGYGHDRFMGGSSLNSVSAPDTTWLATYDFDSGGTCVPEGWVTYDATAPNAFHHATMPPRHHRATTDQIELNP